MFAFCHPRGRWIYKTGLGSILKYQKKIFLILRAILSMLWAACGVMLSLLQACGSHAPLGEAAV